MSHSERGKPSSLSVVVSRTPSLFDGEKLSLVGVDLREIDQLNPRLASSVKILYLSNNYLSTLTGVEQFPNLVAASFTNNFIRYLDELQPLSRLRRLQKTSFNGNVVTKMPYYREHVVTLCPELASLDGIKVTQEDRARAKLVFFKVKAFYDQLRLNELRNAVLVHVNKTMACHLQLRREVFGRFRHMFSAHIGSAAGAGTERISGTCVRVGAGAILQQALRGGVYRWLQAMASRHFNHLVQDNVYKLLAAQQRQGGGQEGPQTGQQAGVWDSLVAAYLREQQEFFLELVEYCEALGGGLRAADEGAGVGEGGGAQSALLDALDSEVLMDCMGQLQFLANNSSSHLTYDSSSHLHAQMQPEQRGEGRERQQQDEVGTHEQPMPSAPARVPAVSASGSSSGGVTAPSSSASTARRDTAPSMCGAGNITPAFPGTGKSASTSTPSVSHSHAPARTSHSQQQGGHRGAGSGLTPSGSGGYQEQHQARLLRELDDAPGQGIYSEGVVVRGRGDLGPDLAQRQVLAAEEQEHVHARYAELLQKNVHGRSAAAAAAGAGARAGEGGGRFGGRGRGLISSCLPPQQTDPDAATAAPAAPEGAQPSRAPLRPCGLTPAPSAQRSLQPQQQQPEGPSAADGVLEALLVPGEGVDVLVPGGDLDTFVQCAFREAEQAALAVEEDGSGTEEGGFAFAPLDLSFSQGVETRWRMTAAAIEAYVLSDGFLQLVASQQAMAPRPFDPAVEASAMGPLKTQIAALSNLYMLGQREEYGMFELHHTLSGTLRIFEQQSLAIADTAVEGVSQQRRQIAQLQGDLRHARIWLDVHDANLQQLEDCGAKIASARALREEWLQQEAELGQGLQAAVAQRAQLQTSLAEVQDAIRSVAAELKTDSDICALVRKQAQMATAEKFWRERARALKRAVFRLLRSRTRRQSRIRHFHWRLVRRRGAAVRLVCFRAWVCFLCVEQRGRQLQRRKQRGDKTGAFRAWRGRFLRRFCELPRIQGEMQRYQLRSAFGAFRGCVKALRVVQVEDARHDLYVSLFRSIRVFRAWKRWTQEGVQRQQHALGEARRRRQRGVLEGWAQVTQQQREEHEGRASAVGSRHSALLQRGAWHKWAATRRFRLLLGEHRRKGRAFRALRRRVASFQRQRALQQVTQAGAGRRVTETALHLTLRRWHASAAKSRHCSLAAAQMSAVVQRKVEGGAWAAWCALSAHFRQLQRKLVALTLLRRASAVRRCFGRWKGALTLEMQTRLSRNATAASEQLRRHHMHSFYAKMGDKVKSAADGGTGLSAAVCTSFASVACEGSGIEQGAKGMSSVDFEMLYLDDFDDEEEEEDEEKGEGEGEGGGQASSSGVDAGDRDGDRFLSLLPPSRLSAAAYCVQLRRYLARWGSRASLRRRLRSRHARVLALARSGVVRRSFATMGCMLGAALLRRVSDLRAFLQEHEVEEQEQGPAHSDVASRRSQLERETAEQQRRREDLQIDVDALLISDTEARDREEQQEAALSDLRSSIAALAGERFQLQHRLLQATQYVQRVQALQDEFLAQPVEGAAFVSVSASASISAPVSRPVSAADASTYTISGMDLHVDLHDADPADERLLLLADVEGLYRAAVQAQEGKERRLQHLLAQREAAHTAARQRGEQLQQLEGRVTVVQEERQRLEASLHSCTAALEQAFQQVARQTETHEAQLRDLAAEEAELRQRLQQLAGAEQELERRLEERQVELRASGLPMPLPLSLEQGATASGTTSSPQEQARREALAVEHLSRARAGSAAAAVGVDRGGWAGNPSERGAALGSFLLPTALKPLPSQQQQPSEGVTAEGTAAGRARPAKQLPGPRSSSQSALHAKSQARSSRDGKENVLLLVAGGGRATAAHPTSRTAPAAASSRQRAAPSRRSTTKVTQPVPAPSPCAAASFLATSEEDIGRQIEELSSRIRRRFTAL